MPHQPGNIYGEDQHPVDQLKSFGKQKRWSRSQECIWKNSNPAVAREQLGNPSPSNAHQDENPKVPGNN